MRVAIVGGGIGGMALALSLVDAGIDDVDIYESAPAIRELGVGINALPHGVTAHNVARGGRASAQKYLPSGRELGS